MEQITLDDLTTVGTTHTEYHLINGDCLEKLDELLENSVGSIVTDPPYRINKYNKEIWQRRFGAGTIWQRW